MRVCQVCRKRKQESEFYRHSRRGFQSQCKKCKASYNREHYRRNREAYKERSRRQKGDRRYRDCVLRKRYGISVDEYDALLEKQHGGCAVCGVAPQDGRRLCVDHCHETGMVRGILCDRCNKVIGLLDDDPDVITKLAKYLRP